jgi:VanZ family protein
VTRRDVIRDARAPGADRALAGWTALIAVLMLAPLDRFALPDLGSASPLAALDKPVHFVLFFVLAVLAARSARGRARWPLATAVAASLLYGALLEAIQGLSGLRSAELGDLVADGLGCSAAALIPARWRRP